MGLSSVVCYTTRMVHQRGKFGLATALLALFVAVFILMPTVDAAACAVEVEPAHAATSVDSGAGDQPTESDDHAICSHGHCHHGGAIVIIGSELSPAVTNGDARILLPSEPLASRTPAGPERPPRG